MEITSNNLLNILLPNDNKALKEVLKQADIQQLTSGSKATNVQEILKNLLMILQPITSQPIPF